MTSPRRKEIKLRKWRLRHPDKWRALQWRLFDEAARDMVGFGAMFVKKNPQLFKNWDTAQYTVFGAGDFSRYDNKR